MRRAALTLAAVLALPAAAPAASASARIAAMRLQPGSSLAPLAPMPKQVEAAARALLEGGALAVGRSAQGFVLLPLAGAPGEAIYISAQAPERALTMAVADGLAARLSAQLDAGDEAGAGEALAHVFDAARAQEAAVAPPADGRLPLEPLLARFASLAAKRGWKMETAYEYADGLPIRSFRTRRRGPALWVIAGIHGEEPAGPNALAGALDAIAEMADAGVPIVLIPMANPKGYRNNWRYPNTAERDWRRGGYSVGDAEHLLPALDGGKRARTARPVGPETDALTAKVLSLARTHPPALVIDMHEDELSAEGGYIYSQGSRAAGHPVNAEIVRLLQASGIPLRLSGRTRFDEPISGGVVTQDDAGRPIRDGSIDELLASDTVYKNGRKAPGPKAGVVIVLETPAFSGSNLPQRTAAHAAVLQRLRALWDLVRPRPRRR